MNSKQRSALGLAGALALVAIGAAVLFGVVGGDGGSDADKVKDGAFPGISEEGTPKPGENTGGEQNRAAERKIRRRIAKNRKLNAEAERRQERNSKRYPKTPLRSLPIKGTLLVPGKVARITRLEGDPVRLRMKTPKEDVLAVVKYDLRAETPAGRLGFLTFDASITGTFDLIFESNGERVGILVIKPK